MSGDYRRPRLPRHLMQLSDRTHCIHRRGQKAGERFFVPMVERIRRVNGQEDRAAFWQVDKERLMAGSMARGEDHSHRAVAKQVIVVRRGSFEEMPVQARAIEIFPDIAGAREPIRGKGILVFGSLNDMERGKRPAAPV